MMKKIFILLFFNFSFLILMAIDYSNSIPAAELTHKYISLLKGKRVGVVANQTSMIKNTHLVDSLLSLEINITKIFCPEHGFRGKADAGAQIDNSVDEKTMIPIISLYGNNKKPKAEQITDLDIIVFDVQDVGARFYTYISTMHYVMEACAENNIPFLILDRPNPTGFYVDGPILKKEFSSFVGMHEVPIIHGMTIAEYAKMLNEEGWLKDGIKCNLSYVLCENYSHNSIYKLPVSPSPNLSTMSAVFLYPSLCLFEGTVISVGRGTDFPFQVIGNPALKSMNFSFVPKETIKGSIPLYFGKKCNGYDLRNITEDSLVNLKQINLAWIIDLYNKYPEKEKFFNSFFNKLSGNSELKEQIKRGLSEKEIRKSWEPALAEFKLLRKKYLLYEDFN
ncbi:MAG: hypothetical protein A2W98_14915 [Bacteroidetes bacterium GWF2_33_38]|nr:MAG: hypothetical protein A2W98_14915 [Bacteroidetes bacterium GWF2_33_38]